MPGACSLFRYSVEKLSTTLSDNLAMSTDLTFVTNEPGNNLRDRFNTLLTTDTEFFDCLVARRKAPTCLIRAR
jgi:hypothetical protein